MEVKEKQHVPATTAPAPTAPAPGTRAATNGPVLPPPAVLPAALPREGAETVAPATLVSPAPFPQRVLAWVDRHRWMLLCGVVGLYLLGFNGQWRLEPDSALYLTIGRNLAEGRGYTYHGEHHHLAYPGLPWLFAATFKAFGTDSLLPAHVIILLCGMLTLALTYRLFYLHAGRPTAVLITVGLALSRTFYRYCFELLSDVPFLMGVMAFLVGYEAIFFRRYDRDVREPSVPGARGKPRWFDWLLLVGGLAVAMVMRPTMWALLLAVVAAVAISLLRSVFRRPFRVGRLLIGGALIAAAVAAGLLFYSLDPRRTGPSESTGDYEIAFLDALTKDMDRLAGKALRTNLPALLHPSASEAVFGIDFGHVDVGNHALSVSALPSLLALAVAGFLFRRRLLWFLWVAVTLLMMLLTVVHVRYFLQVLPMLLYGWWLAILWLNRRAAAAGAAHVSSEDDGAGAGADAARRVQSRLRLAQWASAAVLAVLVGLNVLRVASLVVEQRRVPFLARYRDGKLAATPALAEVMRAQTPEGAWVLVPQKHGRILTYLSRRFAVEPGPVTNLDPAEQPVYVLEPLDDTSRAWMGQKGIGIGPALGPAVRDRKGRTWQLHRAVRAPATNTNSPSAAHLSPEAAASR